MRPTARFLTADGREVELGHGDLVGRLESAALHLPDPRVSEAHAMVSLRGAALKLLALRGRLGVGGRRLAEVELTAGLVVHLALDLSIEVVAVTLPDRALAVRLEGAEPRVVTGVTSLFVQPAPGLRPGFHGDAAAHLWPTGDGVRLRRSHGPDERLRAGAVAIIGGARVEVVEVGFDPRGAHVTTARGGVGAPIELVTRYESATIYRQDEPALTVTGLSARILSELVAFGVPVPWETLARELWPEETSLADLRARWDVNLGRLRKKLEEARVRTDLVRPDGRGNVSLALERDDVVRDEA